MRRIAGSSISRSMCAGQRTRPPYTGSNVQLLYKVQTEMIEAIDYMRYIYR